MMERYTQKECNDPLFRELSNVTEHDIALDMLIRKARKDSRHGSMKYFIKKKAFSKQQAK
ncbi:MAG: hypothetical protein AB2792_07025 [Candidatus Thiodiazotropha sp.]